MDYRLSAGCLAAMLQVDGVPLLLNQATFLSCSSQVDSHDGLADITGPHLGVSRHCKFSLPSET